MLYQYSLQTEANTSYSMIANLPIIVRVKYLDISSPAFEQNKLIPKQYTCDGQNDPPELHVNSIPIGTKSMAVIVDDPDAPVGPWAHWIAWNIKPGQIIIPNKIRCKQGLNDFGMLKYCGPCPPNGIHHYHFKVFALDCYLMNLNTKCTKYQLEKAMTNHILAFGTLIGQYKRQ